MQKAWKSGEPSPGVAISPCKEPRGTSEEPQALFISVQMNVHKIHSKKQTLGQKWHHGSAEGADQQDHKGSAHIEWKMWCEANAAFRNENLMPAVEDSGVMPHRCVRTWMTRHNDRELLDSVAGKNDLTQKKHIEGFAVLTEMLW